MSSSSSSLCRAWLVTQIKTNRKMIEIALPIAAFKDLSRSPLPCICNAIYFNRSIRQPHESKHNKCVKKTKCNLFALVVQISRHMYTNTHIQSMISSIEYDSTRMATATAAATIVKSLWHNLFNSWTRFVYFAVRILHIDIVHMICSLPLNR